MSRNANRIATMLLAFALAGCATSQKPDGYEDAARSARLNAQSPAHSLYHEEIERRTRLPLERAGRDCSYAVPDTRGVHILHRLDESGTPVETLVYPDADYGRCLLQAIGDVEYPPPPEPDYWVGVVAPGS